MSEQTRPKLTERLAAGRLVVDPDGPAGWLVPLLTEAIGEIERLRRVIPEGQNE